MLLYRHFTRNQFLIFFNINLSVASRPVLIYQLITPGTLELSNLIAYSSGQSSANFIPPQLVIRDRFCS